MNKKVCGADVCKDKIVCCFVTDFVSKIKEEFKEKEHEFFEFKVTMEDVARFLEHQPTHLILEPTGTNYAWIWAEIATQNGIEVLWVDNAISRSRRISYGLPDKNDQADALTLAKLGFAAKDNKDVFIKYTHKDGLSVLRDSVLQLESINKMTTMVTNRIRQQLAREFPEVALTQFIEGPDGQVPLLAWLARRERKLKRKSTSCEDKWRESVAYHYGIEISDFTRSLAETLCYLGDEKDRLKSVIKAEMIKPEFYPYYCTILRFGLDDKAIAFIIAMIFPIEKFFHKKGMRRSRARFKQRLGLGRVDQSSGDKSGSKVGGSALARKLLNVYINRTAGNQKTWRPITRQQDAFVDYYERLADKWSTDPEAIAQREQLEAIDKARKSLAKSLKKLVDADTLQSIQDAVADSIQTKVKPKQKAPDAKKRWGRLINARTAAKLAELIWNELLDELYPKPDKTND